MCSSLLPSPFCACLFEDRNVESTNRQSFASASILQVCPRLHILCSGLGRLHVTQGWAIHRHSKIGPFQSKMCVFCSCQKLALPSRSTCFQKRTVISDKRELNGTRVKGSMRRLSSTHRGNSAPHG